MFHSAQDIYLTKEEAASQVKGATYLDPTVDLYMVE
jgi:hypothetical protein